MIQRCLPTLFVFLFCLGSQSAHSQTYEVDTTSIREVVTQWNEASNEIDEDAFNKLYAPTVLFYTNHLTKKVCLEKKLSLLGNGPFEQRIISDLTLAFYEEGIVYCGFTKEVTAGKGKKSYPSYLLLKRVGDRYLITGESDLITDRNLKFHLSLGPQIHISELSSTSLNKQGWTQHQSAYWMLAILLLVIGVTIYVFKKRSARNSKPEKVAQDVAVRNTYKENVNPAELMAKLLDRPRKEWPSKKGLSKEVALARGHTFEMFVVKRFRENGDHFKWIDATSDKGTGEYYPESNLNPDLTYEYRIGSARYPFFVECKFRAATSGQIEITKDGQLERYKRFGMEKGMEVFIVLGLGGTPAKPNELFVIPISEARQTMDRKTLNAYKAQPSFYFDSKKRRLY